MSAISIVKRNSISVCYDTLTEEGRVTVKKQSFDLMPIDATDQDFLDLGNALNNVLEYSVKEIQKNNLAIIVEA